MSGKSSKALFHDRSWLVCFLGSNKKISFYVLSLKYFFSEICTSTQVPKHFLALKWRRNYRNCVAERKRKKVSLTQAIVRYYVMKFIISSTTTFSKCLSKYGKFG
jgi:hypothetical protein